MRTCSALRSTSLYTATLLSPSSRQARMTRSAISPRLAISTLRKGQSDVEIVCTRMLPSPGTRKGALIIPRRVLHYISRVPGSLTDPASIPGTRKGQCHSNKKNIAKGRVFQMEGGMPALLPMEAGKSAFDDARAEAQATGRQQRLGITEISEQARMQAGQLAGLDDGELIAGGVQHMQSMAKTEAIRIEVGLQG